MTETLLTVHVKQLGTLLYGNKRLALEFDNEKALASGKQIDAVFTALTQPDKSTTNATASLARAICKAVSSPGASLEELEKAALDYKPFEFERTPTGELVSPTKLSYPATLYERVDCEHNADDIRRLTNVCTTENVSVAARNIATFMLSHHHYRLPTDACDMQLLQFHAIQNAVALMHAPETKAMFDSVQHIGASSPPANYLNSDPCIDAYLFQETPAELICNAEAREASGMTSKLVHECSALAVTATDEASVPVTVASGIAVVVSDAVMKCVNSAAFSYHGKDVTAALDAIKIWRGAATLHIVDLPKGGFCVVAIYNWHASNKGLNFPETFAIACDILLDALDTVAKDAEPDAVDWLAIVAGDSNLNNTVESALAASELNRIDTVMYNSANPDESSKCCKITVNRGGRQKTFSTQWQATKLEQTIAPKDVLVKRANTGKFTVSASVNDSGLATPRDGYLFDHSDWKFAIHWSELRQSLSQHQDRTSSAVKWALVFAACMVATYCITRVLFRLTTM